MDLDIRELKIIERLLVNRLNAGFDPEISDLLYKVRNQTEEACEEQTS